MSNREIAAIRNAANEARRHYRVRECLGVSPELERVQPGHTRAVIALFVVMAVLAAAYIYGAWKGI